MTTNRRMRCPYCNSVFTVTMEQQIYNYRFKCPYCKRVNKGSVEADENGVLIGERETTW